MEHIHPAVKWLAVQNNVFLSPRVVRLGHYFDGKTIATFWTRCFPSLHRDKKVTVRIIPFSDHDLLHEIAHFVVASPEQRTLPEFGLGSVGLPGQRGCPNVVDIDDIAGIEAERQELEAQRLCFKWGKRYNISPILSAQPFYVSTWDEYQNLKIAEWNKQKIAF